MDMSNRTKVLKRPDREIISAARDGKLELIKAFLSHGVSVDYQEMEGSPTALATACRNGFVEIVLFLLSTGADIDRQDKEHRTALIDAVMNNRPECVTALMEHGANPNLCARNGWTPLYIAANKGFTSIANTLLHTHSVDVNMDIQNTVGGTVLMVACMQGHADIVDILLEKGANVNTRDKQNWTALTKAADKGHAHIVHTLLERGADTTTVDKSGFAALHHAARAGHIDVVAALLRSKHQSGIDINAVDYNGRTALFYAAQNRHFECVRALWLQGADTSITDKNGDTALSVARSSEIVELLAQTNQPLPTGAVGPVGVVGTVGVTDTTVISVTSGLPTSDSQNVWLEYSEIPLYLHSGEFYKNLNPDGDFIVVPATYFKPDDIVTSTTDFALLLRVIQFWGLDALPEGMCLFCITQQYSMWSNDLNALDPRNQIAIDLVRIFGADDEERSSFVRAIIAGRSELVGSFAVLRLDDDLVTMNAAASAGRKDYMTVFSYYNYNWDATTCAAAAGSGQLDCLEYARTNGCPWDHTVYSSCITGNRLYMISGNRGIDIDNNFRACIDYAERLGVLWHVDVCVAAAKFDVVEDLHFVREHGCPWDDEVTLACARQGLPLCLKYAVDNGCPYSLLTCQVAYEGNHLSCLKLVWSPATATLAASTDDLPYLQYLHAHGCTWDATVTDAAGLRGHEVILRYALNHQCPHSEQLVRLTVRSGNLACLQYVIEEQGLYMNEDGSVFGEAFAQGDLQCMQYLCDIGCPFANFSFTSDRRDNSISTTEWDVQLCACIEYAVGRGWTVNPEMKLYVRVEKLSLCWEFLSTNFI